MKGILLAGGNGTRLAPLTNFISKQLLPVYDKPLICYPLATLINLNIRDILIISTINDTPKIKEFLQDGSDYGIKISYAVQAEPKGIADAFLIGEDFIGDDNVCLILGDNIFYGSEISGNDHELQKKIKKIESKESGALVFAYHVSDPERYGVINFDENDHITSIEEKPKSPKSHFATTGLYIYDSQIVEIVKNLKPSSRGELEITDVNNAYLAQNKLEAIRLKRGFAWLDAGTPDSLLDSAKFIQTIEKRQGLKIACLEEISYRKGFITKAQFDNLIIRYSKDCDYRKYLEQVMNF